MFVGVRKRIAGLRPLGVTIDHDDAALVAAANCAKKEAERPKARVSLCGMPRLPLGAA